MSAAAPPPALNSIDFIVVSIYFLLVLGTGILSSCRRNRNTVSGFFLAGRLMSWLPVGASLFASNIGSEHFIGLAGSGAADGISVGAFEFNACILLQLLGWVFLPVFLASKVETLPDYMKKRFGGNRIRIYLACLSLILYVFTKISVNLFSGAIFIQLALRWSLWWSVIGILLVTMVTTLVGGLAAVIYTDTLQFFIMIGGSFVVMFKAFSAVGGYSELQTKYLQAIPQVRPGNSTCGIPSVESWVMLRGIDSSVMPWLGYVFGQTPASIWYWCADQMMVQRALSSRNLSHAQGATLFAGFIKFLPIFLMVIPGMISRVMYPDEIGCVNPDECVRICGNPASCSNIAYPRLVLDIMPQGLRGVMISVMLAALMSDLTSIFNSASTLFSLDIFTLIRPSATERMKVVVGRIFVVIMVLVSVAWLPVITQMQGGQMYIYIQTIAAFLSPPIASVYLMSVLVRRLNEQGAFWGLMIGFVIGVVRMILEFVYLELVPCNAVSSKPYILQVHYMYFAMFVFFFTSFASLMISLVTKPGDRWRLVRTTFATRFSTEHRPDELDTITDIQPSDVELNIYMDNNGQPTTNTAAVQAATSDNRTLTDRILNYICGCDQFRDLSSLHASQHPDARAQAVSATIAQKRWHRAVLNCMLVAILAGCVTCLVYFSVNPFTEQQVRALQSQVLPPDL